MTVPRCLVTSPYLIGGETMVIWKLAQPKPKPVQITPTNGSQLALDLALELAWDVGVDLALELAWGIVYGAFSPYCI